MLFWWPFYVAFGLLADGVVGAEGLVVVVFVDVEERCDELVCELGDVSSTSRIR